MDDVAAVTLKGRLDEANYLKLLKINSPTLHNFVAKYLEHCNPYSVFINDDSAEAIDYIRKTAIEAGEEGRAAISGHTYHFDNAGDQGRDKKNTRILVPKGIDLGPAIDTRDRDEGYEEVHQILKDIMIGRKIFISFFCLGPANSPFTIPCVQLTDSSYVIHNEFLLYRPGYQEFIRRADIGTLSNFFKFVHSQGDVDERKVSKNLDKRRIYIDLHHDTVYSTNTQYGGNSIGMKKLAMRLAILKASSEDWLTEHMLILGIRGPRERKTFFTGAYPSMCGKTSTAMLEGESIVGDDIAYLRKVEGEVRAANTERGMFGIIQGVNAKDDPLLWKALNSPGEIIFSNVLVTDTGDLHWIDKGVAPPHKGMNYAGEWYVGKKDAAGKDIPPSHPNARFTLALNCLDNVDPRLDDPEGFDIGGMVYGGRDSDTWVPVEESFDWIHGIVTKGASLESETTAATLGKEGVREINPMANLDFLSVTIGKYIQMNIDFGTGLKKVPLIFSVNYFLRDKHGKWLNERNDKKVWYEWMERRVHHDANAIKTPTGLIPLYDDLKILFKESLHKDYSEEEYNRQFAIRIPENLAKIERVKKFYETEVTDTPTILFEVLEAQKKRLLAAREKFGDYILPIVLLK
ncbi:MAG: phosphoenolpyruvate carboxykinase (GTP) [Dissulfurispiraceae bacterium]